jgi:release factor glutamine methyltransferase
MTVIKQAIMEAASFLSRKGLESPRVEAELLLAFLLQRERLYLYLHGEEELTAKLAEDYLDTVQRRGAGEPLAYITGIKEFMGLNFRVGKGVLIPRPETEHLVEGVINWFNGSRLQLKNDEPCCILDLGTGCGNIALSLVYFLPGVMAVGVDISKKALKMALLNATELGLRDRVKFLNGDYWQALSGEKQKFHAIVSNPPYIPVKMLASLSREVQQEPLIALDGGTDGLEAYRKIFSRVREYLNPSGLLALEVGAGQAGSVLEMGRKAGFFKKNDVIKDYAGVERVVLLA